MRKEVPATCTVPIVVEPRAKNKIRRYGQESTVEEVVLVIESVRIIESYMMRNQVKNPQWLR
jgi:hypothetical protein